MRSVFLVAGLLAVEPVTAHNQPFLRNAAPQLLRPVRHVIKANIAVTPSNEITPEWLETLETDQDGKKRMSTIDAVGIIAGTAIGGGFLALPAVTAPLGYLPSAFGLLAVWGFLSFTALTFVEAAGYAVEEAEAEGEPVTVSHASIISRAFGPRLAFLGGCAFCAQMVAVITAQVVKGGEFLALATGAPYRVACILPTVLVGLFTFLCKPGVVERANTALATAMLFGFAALVAGAIAFGAGGGVAAAGVAAAGAAAGAASSAAGAGAATASAGGWLAWLTRGQWAQLLPFGPGADTWAVPVFLNLLCFTQSVPLIVQRLLVDDEATSRGTNGEEAESSSEAAAETRTIEAARWTALGKTRTAILSGSAVPLVLSLIWAAVATALVPAALAASGLDDPLFSLLTLGSRIAIPVGTLAVGAIGTTLLSSFLAFSHFANELLCSYFGYCSRRQMAIVNFLTVAVPCLLACGGSTLYLPLLAFAGAYPTTLLYCLSPPLAAWTLRRRVHERRRKAMDAAKSARAIHGAEGEEEAAWIAARAPPLPRPLLPGGTFSLVVLASSAVAVLAASSWIAIRQLLSVIARA